MSNQTETRESHLEWCKKRALEYCDQGYIQPAFASFMSDMRKDERTANHGFLEVFEAMYFTGSLNGAEEMRRAIEGFN